MNINIQTIHKKFYSRCFVSSTNDFFTKYESETNFENVNQLHVRSQAALFIPSYFIDTTTEEPANRTEPRREHIRAADVKLTRR